MDYIQPLESQHLVHINVVTAISRNYTQGLNMLSPSASALTPYSIPKIDGKLLQPMSHLTCK